MEELLKPEMVEAIIMSATVGQFGQEIVEEALNETWKKMDKAKAQLVNHLISGGSALTAYILTQNPFNPKAATIAFLSGVFATVALKMLKKKNCLNADKAQATADRMKDIEIQSKTDRIKYLEKELKIKVELLKSKNDLSEAETPESK